MERERYARSNFTRATFECFLIGVIAYKPKRNVSITVYESLIRTKPLSFIYILRYSMVPFNGK